MNTGILFTVLFMLSGSLLIDCRHVTLAKPSTSLVNDNQQRTAQDRYDEAHEGLDSSELFDGLTLASYGDRNYTPEQKLENRQFQRVFNDFGPYMGKFIYRLIVRRALIKPMVKGMKKLVPGSIYQYYNDIMLSNRIFQMMEPLSPAISSYTYSKFEQGVFWSLKRAGTFVMDNFIEFER
ncbi:hypothetical protein GHT06_019632 [Daphnia sinensis]|uniref:Uncharacterized protein n=1 Tax=Daphnia sinensis TaxID=1820382 RepID=A0AAD5L348_9CRUS|nr:hypothetical protein GHT06_019632 [Daphnia sinensis]